MANLGKIETTNKALVIFKLFKLYACSYFYNISYFQSALETGYRSLNKIKIIGLVRGSKFPVYRQDPLLYFKN